MIDTKIMNILIYQGKQYELFGVRHAESSMIECKQRMIIYGFNPIITNMDNSWQLWKLKD